MSLVFNSVEEMLPYYNKQKNGYDFAKDGSLMDVEFRFDLNIICDIRARNINAWNIFARNINAWNIFAGDINACDIFAGAINAGDICYYAVCFAYRLFKCKSVIGRRENAKHFCLDRDIEFIQSENAEVTNENL